MDKIKAGSFAVVSGKRYKKLNGKLVLIKKINSETALTETVDGQINSIPINHLKQSKE